MVQAHPTGASPNAHLLIGEMPAPRQLQGRWWEGTGLSIVVHAIVAGILIYAASHVPGVVETAATIPDRFKVFLDRPGPGGESAGSGTARSNPPLRSEIAAARPLEMTPNPKPADMPPPEVSIPVIAAQAQPTLPGALIQMATASPGRGTAPGDGDGKGVGRGSDEGSGRLGGSGGETMGLGNGVISPVLLKEVKPGYTVNAMRAKLQGVVEMEAVVLADGSVDPASVRVTRSLDSMFGLDQQAITAVKQWHFRPGTFKGQPVAVRVNVELTFTLR